MLPRPLALLVPSLVLLSQSCLWAQNVIIPQSTAQRHGLVRAWHAQVELDRSTDHIAYITQQGGILYIQTTHAMVHALDAETGRSIWSVQIGRRHQMSLAPGVNDEYLAVINGSTVFVVDRKTGRLKFERQLGSAPGAGPALSATRLFVPMVSGLLEGYSLKFDEHKELPWVYKSAGRILTQPIVTEGNLAWTTAKGYFYVADANLPKTRFRVETQGEINSRPTHWTPYLYACSLDGYVYAVNETTGQTAWKFSSGHPITKQPAAVEDHLFVAPDSGGMFCLHGKTGAELWFAPGITDFLSVSATKVYVLDHLNRLTTLDLNSGSRLDTLPLNEIRYKLINQQTDRIYLATDTGIVQCLHEMGLQAPVIHKQPVLLKKGAKPEAKPADDEPADDTGAVEPVKKPAKAPADDMSGDEEEPADEGMNEPADDNPFGE